VISANGEMPSVPTRKLTFKAFTDSLGKMVDCLQVEKNRRKTKPKLHQKRPPKLILKQNMLAMIAP
jgi:hypothetical protein